jgi:hypothetical protein
MSTMIRSGQGAVLVVALVAAGYIPPAGASLAAQAEGQPADLATVLVDARHSTIMELPVGGSLVIPAGAVASGATVRASQVVVPPGATPDLQLIGVGVELTTDPESALRGPVTLRLPVPEGLVPPGLSGPAAFGMATFDPAMRAWIPVPAHYDPVRGQVVAELTHFSWYNPFSWDWASIGASINQGVGQLLGKRAGAASCPRGQPVPRWVASTPGITNDAAVAIRSCAEGEGDVLVVELVNNRPHGMTMTYGAAVEWGWHERGGSGVDIARNAFGDRIARSGTLYLPPLSRASVGIKPMNGGSAAFAVGITRESLVADVAAYLAPELLSRFPAGTCASFLAQSPPDSLGDLLGLVEDIAGCLSSAASRWGDAAVARLAAIAIALGSARLIGRYWRVADLTWRFADLFVDSIVMRGASQRGTGFTVFARSTPPPAPRPRPAPPPAAPAPRPPADWEPNGGSSVPVGCPSRDIFYSDWGATEWMEVTGFEFARSPLCVRPTPPYPNVEFWTSKARWAAAIVDVTVTSDYRTGKPATIQYVIIMYNPGWDNPGDGWLRSFGSSWALWRTADGPAFQNSPIMACQNPPDAIQTYVSC